MAQRQVKNQFNITSSVIGQLSVGNKGPVVHNQQTKRFEAGSRDVDYKISGGHFPQANIGGEATYNNKDSVIGGSGGGGKHAAGKPGLTVQQIMYGGGREAETSVLNILKSGIDANSLKAILQNGIPIKKMEKALCGCPRGNYDNMVQSMLRTNAMEDDSDTTSSDSDWNLQLVIVQCLLDCIVYLTK